MPLFEYRCRHCRKRFAQLIGMTADSRDPVCPECGSNEVSKLVSRFIRARSEDETLDAMEDSALSADMDDPSSVHKWMREMGKAMDEDDGDAFEEYLEEAEKEVFDGDQSTAEI